MNLWIIVGFGLIKGLWDGVLRLFLATLLSSVSSSYPRPEIGGYAFEASGIARTNLMQSTTGQAEILIVNGPLRRQLGFNATENIFGPGDRANATVGRALTFDMCPRREMRCRT